jgi:5'(3')-deoxyribonucleotidase
MQYLKSPTESIFYDAYAIADAIIYQQDQETRMLLAIKREGVYTNKVAGLSNDIVRLDVLIQDRIRAFENKYGNTSPYKWHQHLADHKRCDRVLAKVEQWAS